MTKDNKKDTFWKPEDLKAADIVGIITIIGGFLLMAYGIDHTVSLVIVSVVGYYFGRRRNNIE